MRRPVDTAGHVPNDAFVAYPQGLADQVVPLLRMVQEQDQGPLRLDGSAMVERTSITNVGTTAAVSYHPFGSTGGSAP